MAVTGMTKIFFDRLKEAGRIIKKELEETYREALPDPRYPPPEGQIPLHRSVTTRVWIMPSKEGPRFVLHVAVNSPHVRFYELGTRRRYPKVKKVLKFIGKGGEDDVVFAPSTRGITPHPISKKMLKGLQERFQETLGKPLKKQQWERLGLWKPKDLRLRVMM